MSDIVYNIQTERHARPIAGMDTSILTMPKQFMQEGVLVLQPLIGWLRPLFEQQARDLGDELHHAEFILTSDPNEAEAWAITRHDCEGCRAGAAAARRHLERYPTDQMICAALYWTGE